MYSVSFCAMREYYFSIALSTARSNAFLMQISSLMDFCSIKCDVSTICIGMAASMGAFLLAGGTKGKRLALPNFRILSLQKQQRGYRKARCRLVYLLAQEYDALLQ